MKMNRGFFKKLVGLLLATCVIAGCSDDENDFKGTDNHLLLFELEQRGVTYKGAIIGEEVKMTVPENISLESATVSFEISEHAVIAPDPATITDWDSAREFTVISYNETPRVYKYVVERTAALFSGDILFTSQEEVDAFAATGIKIIDGYVTIGKATGGVALDTIYDLSPLSGIQEITYALTINPTYGGERIDAFKELGKLGGLVLNAAPNLIEVDFGAVTDIKMDILLSAPQLTDINLRSLKSIGGAFTGTTNRVITGISLPALEKVGGDFSLTSWLVLEKLELPELKEAGGLSLGSLLLLTDINMERLEKCDGDLTVTLGSDINAVNMPLLEYTGSLTVTSGSARGVEQLNLPALREVTGGLSITNMKIEVIDNFGSLQKAGYLWLSNNSQLELVSFPALETLDFAGTGSALSISAAQITDLDGFSSLTSVNNTISITNCKALRSFEGLKNCIGTFESTWTVNGNLYNPTLEDMRNEKYTPEEE